MNLPPHLQWLQALPLSARVKLLREVERALGERKLATYKPYSKQREFHEAGATYRERMLAAGNRLGKTWSAGAEWAMHLTGRYPDWWRGKVFHRGQQMACASETGLLTRDGLQRILFGYPAFQLGTGMVPKDAINETVPSAHGPKGLFEHVRVRHGGGGDVQADESVLYLRSYDQGRERIQAMELGGFWMDEEPPDDYYFEAMTRTNITLGPVMLTYTPLKGMSTITKRFFMDKVPGTYLVQMGIEDADHIPPDVRAAIIASYPAHEREARVHGVPVLGSGRVFVVPEERFVIEPIQLQPHWPRIVGIDFGYDHPTAVVWMAWDRDTDTVYVYDCYRSREALVPVHAAVLRAKGEWIPVAWPHDGDNDTAAGPALAKQYRAQGINFLPESAKFPEFPGTSTENTQRSRRSVEGGVAMIQDRLIETKLKVFSTLSPWLEEYRLYHRVNGVIVKMNDDLMSATRYGLMCLDYAALPPAATRKLNPHRRTNWRAA